MLVLLAAAVLGYALATANDPLLQAGRDFTALAFLCGGTAFLLYVLLNFGPLLRQKKAVYRVVFEPRRLPFYALYVLTLVALVAVTMRNNFFLVDQVQAASFNNLGDLSRLESELTPDDMSRALLAERYYAESDDLDQHNHKASLGRAALYRFRLQRQNEINILRRALEPAALRPGFPCAWPPSTTSPTTSSTAWRCCGPVCGRTLPTAPSTPTWPSSTPAPPSATRSPSTATGPWLPTLMMPRLPANELAYRISQQQWDDARALVTSTGSTASAAFRSNVLLLAQLTGQPAQPAALPDSTAALSSTSFALLYHDGLNRAVQGDTTLLPLLPALAAQPDNAPYLDQLTFLRAFTQHYGGRPVAAQTTIMPLATGSGPDDGLLPAAPGPLAPRPAPAHPGRRPPPGSPRKRLHPGGPT